MKNNRVAWDWVRAGVVAEYHPTGMDIRHPPRFVRRGNLVDVCRRDGKFTVVSALTRKGHLPMEYVLTRSLRRR